MTTAAPGVLVRHAGEPRAQRYRKKPQLQNEFHVEAAYAALRDVVFWKRIAIRLRAR